MVAEDEDIDVVCVCLENVARLLKVGLKFKLNYVHAYMFNSGLNKLLKGFLAHLSYDIQECGPMSIGAVPNCPEMVVNSVKAVMGSKCKCMDRG